MRGKKLKSLIPLSSSPRKLVTLKKRFFPNPSSPPPPPPPKSSPGAEVKSVKKLSLVSSQVLSRLKKTALKNVDGDDSARDISREISSMLHGNNDSVGLPSLSEPNDGMLLDNILDIPWFSNMPNSCTSQRRKKVSRERKQKYIFKNTQSRRFERLVKMCANKLGTESTLEVFGKLGRETGIKEYNALLKLCIDKARQSNDEEDLLVQIHKAFQLLRSMRQHGFQLEEETYGPFLLYLIDMEMAEEFHFLSRFIGDENPGSYSRIGYYEMLLWVRVGDENKIQDLCSSIGAASSEDNYYLAESYLLAFCESDRKKELLQLLEVLDIRRISSLKYVESIFMSLGRLQLESFTEKFVLALKTTEAGDENISSFIYSYAVSMPNLVVEEVFPQFKNLHEKLEVIPSIASYDKLIKLCCNSFKVHAAVDIVDHMCQSGLVLSIETFHSILRAIEQSCELDLVRPIYSLMRSHNLKPKGETFRSLISLFVKMKDFKGAYNLLGDAEEMNMIPTSSMYNAIMAGYFREKNIHGGLMVLKQMEDADLKPDSETFSYLLSNCECEEDITKYRDEIQRAGVQLTKQVYMALIHAYANCGKFELAKQVVLDQGIPVKFLNEIKSALVSALSSNGQMPDALNVYDEIKQAGWSVEPKAIISLIEHLRSEGELDRLIQLLGELNNSGCWFDGCSRVVLYCVRYNHSNNAVDLLKQLKKKDESGTYIVIDQIFSEIWETEPTNLEIGLELLRAVKEDLDFHPSRTSLDFLLSACVKAKDARSAQFIWSEYDSAGLSLNVLTFLRMYQAYLATGEHTSASKMLKRIPKSDPHVRYIIKACEMTYGKSVSVTGKKK